MTENDSYMLWWREQMETFSALLALCEGESTCLRWIPLTKASDAELWYLLKQSKRWWFEKLSRSLWRHFNVKTLIITVSADAPVPYTEHQETRADMIFSKSLWLLTFKDPYYDFVGQTQIFKMADVLSRKNVAFKSFKKSLSARLQLQNNM